MYTIYILYIDATPTICPTTDMGWGGVDVNVPFNRIPSTLNKMSADVDATLTWGGVGMLTFLQPRSFDLHKMLMLRYAFL